MMIPPSPLPKLAKPPNAPTTIPIPPIAIAIFAILDAKFPISSGTFLFTSPMASASTYKAPPAPIKETIPVNCVLGSTVFDMLLMILVTPIIAPIVAPRVASLGINLLKSSGILLFN